MKTLIKVIQNAQKMPAKVLEDFTAQWEQVSYSKGAVLSVPGKTDKYLYFTISGIQKAYYLLDGKPYIVSFTQPNHFTCAPESFLTQKPSQYYFQCINDSDFYRISHQRFSEQVHKHYEIQEFLTSALMGLVNNITDRFLKQGTYSIEEKFQDFMKRNIHLINIIPHKDIANYLNMNPTNFSKLLNSIVIQ